MEQRRHRTQTRESRAKKGENRGFNRFFPAAVRLIEEEAPANGGATAEKTKQKNEAMMTMTTTTTTNLKSKRQQQ